MTLNHFVAHGGGNFTLLSWGFGPACGLVCLKFRVVKDSKLLNTYRRRRFSDLKYWSTCSAFTPWQKHIRIRSVNQVKGPEEVIGALWSKLEARFRFWVSCRAVCMHLQFLGMSFVSISKKCPFPPSTYQMTRINFLQNRQLHKTWLSRFTNDNDYCTSRGAIGLCGNCGQHLRFPFLIWWCLAMTMLSTPCVYRAGASTISWRVVQFLRRLEGVLQHLRGNGENPPSDNFRENTLEETAGSVLSSIYGIALKTSHCITYTVFAWTFATQCRSTCWMFCYVLLSWKLHIFGFFC